MKKQFKWLADNASVFDLNIPMFSLISSSTKQKTSTVFNLANSYLFKVAGINDGAVNASNQFLPSSFLLGIMNADHWALILPFSPKSKDELSGLNNFVKKLANRNKFPREALLESIIKQVDKNL